MALPTIIRIFLGLLGLGVFGVVLWLLVAYFTKKYPFQTDAKKTEDAIAYISNSCSIFSNVALSNTSLSNLTSAVTILKAQKDATKDCTKISNLISISNVIVTGGLSNISGHSNTTSSYIMGANMSGGGMLSSESQIGGMDIAEGAPF